MRRAIITLLVLLSFGLKAQVYQAMPQAGYGPVKRMLFDSVLTIPLNINQLRNITGGRDAGQIRYNVTDSGLYVYSGYQWIKANLDSTNISNRINGKLNISDTAAMLLPYMKFIDTVSLSNRINLRVKYSDTAQMLSVYLRKLDTASLSRRIDKKQDSITLTTNFKSGAATLIGATLNIPKYSDTLQDNYVPYTGANKDVDLGAYGLRANKLKSDFLLEIQNQQNIQNETLDYTSIGATRTGFSFYTGWMQGNTTYTQSNIFVYANLGQQNNSRQYNLPVRNGTLSLVEDTVNLSNRINLKADKATVLTINGVGYDLSANRTWTIPVFDSTSISNRLNLKLNISDTASMLSPYLRKADTSSLSNRIDLRVKYSDTAAMLSPYLKSAVTSVGLSMPNAFNVTNSPITSTGTIAVTGAGTAAQYIRGDGQLATLPSGVSGGSSVNYYLNGSVNQGTIGGSVYYEMNKTPVIGAGTDFALAGNGLISQFITDVADPNRLQIPAGNWNFEIYMSASSSGGTPKFYVELLKYDGTNFTSIASSSANPEAITNGTTIDLYLTALAIPQTTLLATDRLAIRVYIVNSTGGRTITMHTENSHLCEIITNFPGGVSALNGLTANTQYLAVGTSGNDFAINSLTDTHTFNLPTASSTKRGALSSTDWSTFNGKMNYSDTVSLSNRINLKLNSSDTISLSNRINTKLNATDTASLSNRINAKADALSGTTNTVPKFTSGTTIGNSNIKDDGNVVTVNATAGNFGALQVGSYNGNILMNTTNSNGGLIFQNTSSSNKLWDFSSDNNDVVFNESNVAPVIKLKAGGNVQVYNLSGTGTRMVVADANGILSTQAISSDTTSLSNRINLKLNISDTASMLSGYQSAINSKQAQINGTGFVKASGTTISYDNSTYYLASNPNGYTSNTGTVTSVAALTLGTSGTDLSSTVANGTTTPVITLNVPTASATNRGALSSTDWTTFNSKESALTFSSPLVRTTNTISIPVATTSVNGYLSATDWTTFNNKYNLPSLTSGSVLFSNGTTIAQDNSNFFFDDTNNRLGIGTATPNQILHISGTSIRPQIEGTGNGGYSSLRFVGKNSGGTSRTFEVGLNITADDVWQVTNGSSAFLNINTTGAATFSGSITSNSGDLFSTDGTRTNYLGVSTGSNIGIIGMTTNHDLRIITNNTQRLLIASTGAATFSSSVTASGAKSQFIADGGASAGAEILLKTSLSTSPTLRRNWSITTEDQIEGDFVIKSSTSAGAAPTATRLAILSGGNVGIGTTSPANRLDILGLNNTTPQSDGISVFANNTTVYTKYGWGGLSAQYDYYFYTAGSERMRITSGGYVILNSVVYGNTISSSPRTVYIDGAGGLGGISSIRESKKNIENVSNIDWLYKLNPVTFNYRKKDSTGNFTENIYKDLNYGLIAEDTAPIADFLINYNDKADGSKEMVGIEYSRLITPMLKAIQELSAQIKELQTEIQTLKNK
jgi:hypothetical protein